MRFWQPQLRPTKVVWSVCTLTEFKSIAKLALAGALGKRWQGHGMATFPNRIVHHANGTKRAAQVKLDMRNRKSSLFVLYLGSTAVEEDLMESLSCDNQGPSRPLSFRCDTAHTPHYEIMEIRFEKYPFPTLTRLAPAPCSRGGFTCS